MPLENFHVTLPPFCFCFLDRHNAQLSKRTNRLFYAEDVHKCEDCQQIEAIQNQLILKFPTTRSSTKQQLEKTVNNPSRKRDRNYIWWTIRTKPRGLEPENSKDGANYLRPSPWAVVALGEISLGQQGILSLV